MKTRQFLNILTVALIFSMVPFGSSWVATPEQNEVTTVQAEAEKGGYRLIDVDTLWQQYQVNYERLLLVDTRQKWEYDAGYIRGAVVFPMEPTWLARLTQRGALEQLLGPDKTKTIVFY